MCDYRDIGNFCDPESEICEKQPVIAIYDQFPGGIGLSAKLFEKIDLILKQCLQTIINCPCTQGCPSCVGPAGENGIGGKESAKQIFGIDTKAINMNDLLKKLQSMGLKIEKGSDLHSGLDKKIPINKIIRGEWLESHGERVFISKSTYPFGDIHGNVVFEKELRYESLSQFYGINELNTFQLQDFLFFDTETSGLSLGTGSIVFLFGGCYFTEKGLEVIQIFLEDPSNEALFLANIDELIQAHKCLISYNGKSFDIPMIRTRMILNRMPYTNLAKDHIDLLHFARSLWKLRLESRRLSDIEKEIMDFERTEDEVPGWLVPQIYQDYLGTGDASPLKGVFYHNEKDIVSLAALFSHINKMVSDKSSLEKAETLDIISIGSIYQRSGNLSLSEDFYKIGLDKGPIKELDSKILR